MAQAHFFKCGMKGREARSYITCVLFPLPLLPFIRLALEEGSEKLMLTQNSFEATNLTRMHVGVTCHKTVRCVQSETDLIGMDMVERPVKDRYFDAVPYTFKPNLKSSGNPVHDRMPVKLRLNGSVSWLANYRSDENQKLTAKVLIEWSKALLKQIEWKVK